MHLYRFGELNLVFLTDNSPYVFVLRESLYIRINFPILVEFYSVSTVFANIFSK